MINAKALGWAAVAVAAASFSICAFLVAIAPATTVAAFSFVMHVDLSPMARSVTWGNFLGGVLVFSVVAGVHAWVLGWMYNTLVARGRGAERGVETGHA